MYQYQEYPKWVNGKVVKSREEELRAKGIYEDARLVHEEGNGGKIIEGESGKNIQLETPRQTSDEKPQETRQEEKKAIYPEKYLGIIIYEHEVMNGGKFYKCCICRKELKYKQRFAKHKAMHDVHHGLKDIKEVNFGFNKRTEKVNNDISGIQESSQGLVEKTE